MNRRDAIRMGGTALALWACHDPSGPTADYPEARLRARPREPISKLPPGVTPLELAAGRDGLMVVPDGATPTSGWPLAVLLHGSGGNAEYWDPVHAIAQDLGLVLLLPESRFGSWDSQDFTADSEFIDRALLRVFARCEIDARRIAIGGFSAGGGYALTLGIANGDLFGDVFAFAPARLTVLQRHGSPSFYVAHGTADTSVPITVSRDEIVPELEERGYVVNFEEFEGGHVVPAGIAARALARI